MPYSEHSSFPELRALLTYLRPRRIIPTVGNSSGAKVAALNALFADLLPSSGSHLASGLSASASSAAQSSSGRPSVHTSHRYAVDGDGHTLTAMATAAAALNVLRAPTVAFSAPRIDKASLMTAHPDCREIQEV